MAWKQLFPIGQSAVFVDGDQKLIVYEEDYEFHNKPHVRTHWLFVSDANDVHVEVSGSVTDIELSKKYVKDKLIDKPLKDVSYLDVVEFELSRLSNGLADIVKHIRGYDDGTNEPTVDFTNIDPNELTHEQLVSIMLNMQKSMVNGKTDEQFVATTSFKFIVH